MSDDKQNQATPALAVAPGSAPDQIWLQWDGDQEPDYYSEHSGVTWAAHQIYKHDVEYVRADLSKRAPEMLRLINELADCYFMRRSEGMLELMMRANRMSSPNMFLDRSVDDKKGE
jgi:hypothetical protein